ncbi:MAG: polyprenyl synthetase family protein [Planctomycetota bacterium]|jgi:octaprenyl-diphosphate synthase
MSSSVGQPEEPSLRLTGELAQLVPGKMLRTRLAARLVASRATPVACRTLGRVCAAVELVHTASLLHDDVIDNGILRRAHPAVWTTTSPSAAILVGDLLLCKSISLLADMEGGRYVGRFVSKVRELCTTEAEQELFLRGELVDTDTCLRLARGKTGPLFAFVGFASGGDTDLAGALEEAGYRIGTAYQVFDDLVDVVGDEGEAKKTLRTDIARRKFTIAQKTGGGQQEALDCVEDLCCVDKWPPARAGIETYIDRDLRPVFDRHLGPRAVSLEPTVRT